MARGIRKAKKRTKKKLPLDFNFEDLLGLCRIDRDQKVPVSEGLYAIVEIPGIANIALVKLGRCIHGKIEYRWSKYYIRRVAAIKLSSILSSYNTEYLTWMIDNTFNQNRDRPYICKVLYPCAVGEALGTRIIKAWTTKLKIQKVLEQKVLKKLENTNKWRK